MILHHFFGSPNVKATITECRSGANGRRHMSTTHRFYLVEKEVMAKI